MATPLLIEKHLIGMNVTSAREYCQTYDVSLRVIQKDGVNYYQTSDYCSDRINVFTRDGKVTHIYSWG